MLEIKFKKEDKFLYLRATLPSRRPYVLRSPETGQVMLARTPILSKHAIRQGLGLTHMDDNDFTVVIDCFQGGWDESDVQLLRGLPK